MDKKFIEDAYRKLKGSVYLDKTVPYMRMRISDFERDNVEQKIENIYNALYNQEKWLEFEQNILDSINVLTFPKKLECEDEVNEEPIVISNVCDNEVVIEKYNNFIDMSVEGHIVGILWILTIGYKMDDNLYINCYGNRLNKNLLYGKCKTTASPNLFKPYFSQYENWRNQGLKVAEDAINVRNNSVVITMLDLTRYYYNVAITEEKYNIMTAAYFKLDDQVLNRINKCIYNIIKTFSDRCNCKRGSMLPIGFLPSNILSNYYLKDLDEKMSKLDGTAYYGRYVDDMILVTELEEETKFNDNILNRGNKYACEYMLELLESSEVLCKKENDKYSISNFPGLYFQKNKFRFFYIDKNGYDTIIEKIHKDICQNASEFNYIPETAIEELNTDILKIEREDTVNKLRAINCTSIDKYVLSKTVEKNNIASMMRNYFDT